MKPVDIIVSAFASELDQLEKTAIGLAGAAGLFGAGALAMPFAKVLGTNYLRSGQQSFGDRQRPQFQRRFGQHLKPPTFGESMLMGGKALGQVGKQIGGLALRGAKPALSTAAGMWGRGPSYIAENLGR